MSQLYIFHPSPYMVENLDNLLSEIAPEIDHENIVYPELLGEAQKDGITDAIADTVKEIILSIPEKAGAVILCSCSTLGGSAEQMQSLTSNKIIRIDRPMVELAVSTGSRIGIAAALKSTIIPTRTLIEQVATDMNKQVTITEFLCETAWSYWEAGNKESYISEIVNFLKDKLSTLDVMVLAQGSMAPAAEQLKTSGVPILTSPRIAIEKVAEMCKSV